MIHSYLPDAMATVTIMQNAMSVQKEGDGINVILDMTVIGDDCDLIRGIEL
jgi:hypothetical protein